jgi:hypothetical protein
MIYLWYPKTGFADTQIGDSIYSPETVCAPFGFDISFREKTISSWDVDVTTVFYTEKPFKKIYISKITYEWEGGTGLWEKGAYTDSAISLQKSGENGMYEDMFIGSISVISQVNLHKIFKGKKLGDEFDFALKIIYSIDDEPEILQIINYRMLVYKNRLRLPVFFGR